MADEVQQQPPLIDPGNITETICDGPVNISVRGPLATLTFTHGRPDDTGSPKDGAMELKSVVRARIVLTGNNLVALRDLLIRAIKNRYPWGVGVALHSENRLNISAPAFSRGKVPRGPPVLGPPPSGPISLD